MRVLLWANSLGMRSYLDACGGGEVIGVVAAANRPQDTETVRRLALEHGYRLYVQPYRREAAQYRDFVQSIGNARPDVSIVHCYSMILDRDLLQCPARGAFNVHLGLLPQYRGANVLNWALLNGERETGVTIHCMDEGVDTGDIVAQSRVPVEPSDTALTLREKLLARAGSLLRETIPRIREGSNSRVPQDERGARHWPRRTPEDGLIDWAWPPEKIFNLIRALVAPWPGAHFYDQEGKKITIDYFMPLSEVELMRRHYLAMLRTTERGA